MAKQVKLVAEIASDLLGNAEKVPLLHSMVVGKPLSALTSTGKRKSKDEIAKELTEEPFFDASVKTWGHSGCMALGFF